MFFHPPYDYYIDQNFGTIKAFYNEDRLKIRSTWYLSLIWLDKYEFFDKKFNKLEVSCRDFNQAY